MKVRTITPAQERRFKKVYYRAHKAELMNEDDRISFYMRVPIMQLFFMLLFFTLLLMPIFGVGKIVFILLLTGSIYLLSEKMSMTFLHDPKKYNLFPFDLGRLNSIHRSLFGKSIENIEQIEKDGKIPFSEIERINNALLSHRKS